ncbi:signal transduction histidine kinase [Branchiibius hedensis]|uniref:histidine kinase n=1 Tax=Branchiibius hedensis TaxID=672460 RepID=A0A2Y9C2G9_9MICO|nr:sensor histidine kinase [Branchiibius hedensis]PWJ27252.1 signal transduction histidine kinase [Branchiibius hedensis]SSA36063.1 Signal transduction histidine kinase [Branchiibius hedensis]
MATVGAFFGVGDPWKRPLPASWWRRDIAIAVAFVLVGALGLELERSLGSLSEVTAPVVVQHVPLILAGVLIVWRRRFPIATVLAITVLWIATGILLPPLAVSVVLQFLYLAGFYAAVAWGAPRGRTVAVVALCVAALMVWVTIDLVHRTTASGPSPGPFPYPAALAAYIYLINAIYFGGAILGGALDWRNARQRAALAEQAGLIEQQAAQLRDRSVVDERVRIARELHDVVAHHVALMGVQAAAARRVLTVDPPAAAGALETVESSARSAVTEMRSLVGTLRGDDADSRTPAPTLADVPALVAQFDTLGLGTTYVLVDGDGLAERVPTAAGFGVYRVVQEALSNVRAHSSAATASVTVRVVRAGEGGYVEAEVLDAGSPVPGTSGTGLGLQGIRERVAALGGEAEIGPRATGGFRVRARIPFLL